MNYTPICPNCKKRVKINTHDGYKYEDEKKDIHIAVDCPECGEEIDMIKRYR